jgi:hypothetical protein
MKNNGLHKARKEFTENVLSLFACPLSPLACPELVEGSAFLACPLSSLVRFPRCTLRPRYGPVNSETLHTKSHSIFNQTTDEGKEAEILLQEIHCDLQQ